jgi:hypothetical protein
MNRASLLQETAAWMDTVDLALCLFIYEVCQAKNVTSYQERD